MTQLPKQIDIANMSIAERIILAEENWDSVVAEQESLEATTAQKEELDRRIELHKTSPDAGTSWEEINKRLKTQE